jgi:hypothetical protein
MNPNERIRMDSITPKGRKIDHDTSGTAFGVLPIRIVETFAKEEFGFEMAVKRAKEEEYERLQLTHPRPSKLPVTEFGSSNTRYIETEENAESDLMVEDESEVAA